jgi:hypothetical protein
VSDYNSKQDRHRLLALDLQLAEIDDGVLSQAVKQKIREAAHAYALWLEADDVLSEMGIDVQIAGGIEFPDADNQRLGVGVVTIESVKIGVCAVHACAEIADAEGDEP